MKAIEITKNNKPKPYGYNFNIMVHPETDLIETFKKIMGTSKNHFFHYEKNEKI